KPENPELPQFGGVKLAQNEEEYLLLELLPAVAKTYLTNKRKAEYAASGAAQSADAAKTQNAAAPAGNGPVFKAPMGGTVLTIKVKPGDEVKPGDTVLIYEAMKMENDLASEIGGKVKRILIGEGDVMATDQPLIEFEGDAAAAAEAPASKGDELLAPMGGTILEFKVKPGDAVKAGDVLLVYEAMKMENNLMAERDGVIEALLLNDGDVMATDQPILRWSAAGGKAKAAE
ncbi:MAG: hypothetical protein J1E95_12175, partial [Muribaculaceae bacterium]|nr:hypothetical protein [Muribaculaceae bacterium]